MKALPTCCAISVCFIGCAENPADPWLCETYEALVDLDEEVEGNTIGGHAAARSGLAKVLSEDPFDLHITTTAFGPVEVLRSTCGDRFSYATSVDVHLRTDDGRIDLLLDGTLGTDFVSLPPRLWVPDVPNHEFGDDSGLEHTLGADDHVAAVRFDLTPAEGLGAILWVLTDGSTSHAASVELPWTEEDHNRS